MFKKNINIYVMSLIVPSDQSTYISWLSA